MKTKRSSRVVRAQGTRKKRGGLLKPFDVLETERCCEREGKSC